MEPGPVVGRLSRPTTRTVLGENSIGPPPVSCDCAPAGRSPARFWALITNRISDNSTHATTAKPTAASPRRQLHRQCHHGARAPPLARGDVRARDPRRARRCRRRSRRAAGRSGRAAVSGRGCTQGCRPRLPTRVDGQIQICRRPWMLRPGPGQIQIGRCRQRRNHRPETVRGRPQLRRPGSQRPPGRSWAGSDRPAGNRHRRPSRAWPFPPEPEPGRFPPGTSGSASAGCLERAAWVEARPRPAPDPPLPLR